MDVEDHMLELRLIQPILLQRQVRVWNLLVHELLDCAVFCIWCCKFSEFESLFPFSISLTLSIQDPLQILWDFKEAKRFYTIVQHYRNYISL